MSCNGCDPHSEVFLALRVPKILAGHSFHGGLPGVFVEQRQKPWMGINLGDNSDSSILLSVS